MAAQRRSAARVARSFVRQVVRTVAIAAVVGLVRDRLIRHNRARYGPRALPRG